MKVVDAFKIDTKDGHVRKVIVADCFAKNAAGENRKVGRFAFWKSTGSTYEKGRWGVVLPYHYLYEDKSRYFWKSEFYKANASETSGGHARGINIKVAEPLRAALVRAAFFRRFPTLNYDESRLRLLKHGIGIWSDEFIETSLMHGHAMLYNSSMQFPKSERKNFLFNQPRRRDVYYRPAVLQVKEHPNIPVLHCLPLAFSRLTRGKIVLSTEAGLGHYVTGPGSATAYFQQVRAPKSKTERVFLRVETGNVKVITPRRAVAIKRAETRNAKRNGNSHKRLKIRV